MDLTATVQLESVSLSYPIYGVSKSLVADIGKFLGKGRINKANHGLEVKALRDIDLTLNHGDRVAVIGPNGSGKTSLLRLIAGVYTPTAGSISVRGRISTLIDIAMGIDSEATGYENIILRGMLLGFTRDEINKRIAEIAEFSGLGSYLALPARVYSSGMLMRLGFSVSSILESDILIMDEWLSVGDAEFNQKASAKLNEIIDKTAILILATHSVSLATQTCNKVIHLKDGMITLREGFNE